MRLRGGMRGVRQGVTLITMLVVLLYGSYRTAAAQVAMTSIQDTVYRADGTAAGGTVVVSWPTFTTVAGQVVAAGSTSATIGPAGAVALSLAPNAGATPTGTFYTAVLHLDDGTTSRQYWVVPVSSTAVKISAIENQVLPTSVAMQTASKAYVDAVVAKLSTGGSSSTGGSTGSYVLKTGDTMTGPLVLPSDPVLPNQASDKNYVDVNVAAITGGMAQKVSLLPNATQTIAQPTGTQLQVNALNGQLFASQFQTGDGGNGIQNALSSAQCSGGCDLLVDAGYGPSESVQTGQIAQAGHVSDRRGGSDNETFVDPATSSSFSAGESLNQISTRTDANSPAVGGNSTGTSHFTLRLSNSAMTGGANQLPGNVENPPYGKSTYGVSAQIGNYYTQGQHVQNTKEINCYAVGDCLAGSQFIMSSGGYRDMADEGAHPFDLQVTEDWRVFQGTCAGGCTTGSTSLMVNATGGGGTQGDGRFLIDKSPAKTLTTGAIVSAGGDVLQIVNFSGTNFPLSVFLQTTAAATSQPKNLAPGTVTLPIATSGVPAGFANTTAALPAQTGVACIADTNDHRFPNFETVNYAVVDASHITLTLNKVHGSGAVVAVGGMCGYGVEQTVDTSGAIRQVFPVIGSKSSTALYYAAASTPLLGLVDQASTSGFANVSLQVASIARMGNVVTLTTAGSMPWDLNGLTLTVSGVTDASYNGSFKVTTTGGNKLTYANTGVDSTSTGGTVSLLTGGFVLYPMAEVLSVYNTATKQVDGQMTLAPNTVAWAQGDAVEEPHYHQQLTAADTELVTQYTPRPIQYSSAGKQYQGEVGPGMRGWVVTNSVAASNYLGGGGTHQLPDDAYMANGPWKTDFEVDAGTQSVIRAHCNVNGCNRWDSGYSLFALDSATGEDFLYYAPQSSTAQWTLGGAQYTFSPTAFTASTAVNTQALSTQTATIGSISATGNGFSSTAKSVGLSQSGDVYGATSVTLENRDGLNGALFQNSGLELVDFAFLNSASYQSNIRVSSDGFTNGYNNAKGEFDFVVNTTGHGGTPAVSTLYMGANNAQFYPGGQGQVAINVPGGSNPNAALAVNGSISVGSYAGTVAAPANGLIVSGSVGIGSSSPVGLLSVGASNQFQVDGTGDVTARQIIGSGAAPTVSASSAAGSGASATVTGTAISGMVTLATGTAPSTSGTVVTVNWTLSAAPPPQGCSLMPRNAAAASATGTIYTGAPSTSGWTVNVGATALGASTSYAWSYQCM